jgi:DNA end-binding protein Ku
VAFHLIDRNTHGRLRRHYVDSETGEPVERDDQVKGYPTGDGAYIIIEPDEIAAAIPESDKTLDVQTFVPCAGLDELFFDRPYYLAPAKEGIETFAMIVEGMRAKKSAAIARTVLFRRMRTVALRPYEAGMIATTLNFDYEVRSAKDAFADAPTSKPTTEMLELAQHIIDTKRGEFDPSKFDDRYENAIAELVRAKLAGRKVKRVAPPGPTPSSELLEALRRSLGGADAAPATPKTAKKAKRAAKPKPAAERAHRAPARRKAS